MNTGEKHRGRFLVFAARDENGTLAGSTYGNGATKSYSYDSLDRITAESYNGVKIYAYDYTKENTVYAVRDYETPDSGFIETKYDYDLARRSRLVVSPSLLSAKMNNFQRLCYNKILQLRMGCDTNLPLCHNPFLFYITFILKC